jgi:hypothetical protein
VLKLPNLKVKEFEVGEGMLNLVVIQDKLNTSGFIGSFCGSIFIGDLSIPRKQAECLTNGLDFQTKHSKLPLKS